MSDVNRPRRFQVFYLVRDKSREFSVCFNASGFNDVQRFFAMYYEPEGFELTRILELRQQ